MKVLILAGGYGTRLSEYTEIRPKPMVEIGGQPILWHIMKLYSHYGFNEFVVLLGYKGYFIKNFFADYFLHHSDVTYDLKNNKMEVHHNTSENWKVTLLDTGEDTMTGGRIKRAKEYIDGKPFMATYGDGVADIDINKLVSHHKSHGKLMTLTAIQPKGRYGALDIAENNKILEFMEKPEVEGSWINGGFFVCQPEVMDYIDGDSTIFERQPLETLAHEQQLMAYRHKGFWHCMDTVSDNKNLNKYWDENNALWKVWK